MKSEKRQQYILSAVKENGFASISEASKRFNVSIETIRRDINKLCKDNLIKKARGGAVSSKPFCRKDDDYLLRIKTNQHQKLTIGLKAASMIQDGSVVAFDAGVSIQSVASSISGVKNVTFVTNSISIANILLNKFNNNEISGRIVFIGGELDVHNRFSKGAIATNEVANYYFDISFVSCTAVSLDEVSSYSLDECAYSKQLIERSSVSVLIAESNKIGKNSICRFARLSKFNTIITDDANPIPEDFKKQCEESKTTLVMVHS